MGTSPNDHRRLRTAVVVALVAALASIVVSGATVRRPAPTSSTSPDTADANQSTPASVVLPVGVTVTSMSWPDARHGWVVGSTGAGVPVVQRTTDGGASWTDATAQVGNEAWTQVLFAGPLDGWLIGDVLASTHDGGTTWHTLDLGSGQPRVYSAALAAGKVLVVTSLGDGLSVDVASAPVTSDTFTMAGLKLSLMTAGGAEPRPVITAGGRYAAVIYNNRTFERAAQIVDGAWTSWTPPCEAPVGHDLVYAALSADGSHLAMICATSQFFSPPYTIRALDHSVDRMTPLPEGTGGQIFDFTAVTAQGSMLAVYGDKVAVSFDAGHTWAITHRFDQADAGRAHAEVPGVGYVISTGPGVGIVTADGGYTWTALIDGAKL